MLLLSIYSPVFQVTYRKRDLIVAISIKCSEVIWTLLIEVMALHMGLVLYTSSWQSFKGYFLGLLKSLGLGVVKTVYKICWKSCFKYFRTKLARRLGCCLVGSVRGPRGDMRAFQIIVFTKILGFISWRGLRRGSVFIETFISVGNREHC